MNYYDMITVSEYAPLAGGLKNTIRKFSPKYEGMQPGDMVIMRYATEFEEDGTTPKSIHAEERLRVAAVVVAPYEVVMQHHMSLNHGLEQDRAELDAFFEKCYPGFASDELFMAVYFES